MEVANLLVELGTEELPPKSLTTLAEALLLNFCAEVDNVGLKYEHCKWYATPRRLAFIIKNIELTQADRIIEKRGPAIKSAYDENGSPTSAAIGWAKSSGVQIEECERLRTEKGEWLVCKQVLKGIKTESLLLNMLELAIARLPINKPMRWGDNNSSFIRPVHTVTVMLNSHIIPGELFGVTIGNKIKGHRFMGQDFLLEHVDKYLDNLYKIGKVISDFDTRKKIIFDNVNQAADALCAQAQIDPALLHEVTSLVEWPVVLTASFEEKFLDVPPEALIYTMKGDQKYFPVFDKKNNSLIAKFIFVTNIESKNPDLIISGNEKVVRPRLADAEFFFNSDKKHPLESYLIKLDSIIFQKQLGTLGDKSRRLEKLSGFIATKLNIDPKDAQRAGLLAKADLTTNMVMEFNDTQGIMGKYYALLSNENKAVALAIEEQYLPKFAKDKVPSGKTSAAVALAEKIDTLVGIFGIGNIPKGDKDPFGLRRLALGVLRIVVENKLDLDLKPLLNYANELYDDKLTLKDPTSALDFIIGRCRSWYLDQGISVDIIQSVLAKKITNLYDFDLRIKAVSHFKTLPEAIALAAATKRVSNIVAKTTYTISTVDLSLLEDKNELNLWNRLQEIKPVLQNLYDTCNYQQALINLSLLKKEIDDFFDNVMVMCDDVKVRNNRLQLLQELQCIFCEVADISLLQ